MRPLLMLLCVMQSSHDALDLHFAVGPEEVVRVSVSGAGDPLVFIPGLLGSSYAFRKVVPLLNEIGFRTVVVDLLGTGRSARPRDADYSLDAQADRVAAVLDSMDITEAGVVAHAIGGSVALRLTQRRPDLVGGLVLLEAGPAESATTAGFRKAMKLAPIIRLLGFGKVRSRIRDQLIEASGDPGWVEADVVAAYTEDAGRDFGATLDAYRAMAAARERDSLAARLPAIREPVLLLVGGAPHSGGPPEREVSLMAQSLPAFSADTLVGVGHFPHEEAPLLVRDAVLQLYRVRATWAVSGASR